MKKSTFLLSAALAGAFAASTASTAFAVDSPVPPTLPHGLQGGFPVLLKVVHPTDLPRSYENATVEVEFTLDAFGTPHDVVPVGRMPSDLAIRLLPAVAKWQFTPYYDATGRPVQRKVILPLKLVEGSF